jgi:hypothetical protein
MPGSLQRHIKSYHKDLRWKLDKEEKEKKNKIRAEMDKMQEEARICPFCQHKFNISAVQRHIIRMHREEEAAAEYEPNRPENSSISFRNIVVWFVRGASRHRARS